MIENSRLAVLYYFVAAGALVFVIQSFVQSQAYLTSGQVKGQVFFRATNWDNDVSIASANLASHMQDLCMNPERYEFCDHANCTRSSASRHFAGFQCINVCTEESDQ